MLEGEQAETSGVDDGRALGVGQGRLDVGPVQVGRHGPERAEELAQGRALHAEGEQVLVAGALLARRRVRVRVRVESIGDFEMRGG